ncbi:hypothetical protein [Stakelama marina]|uniref:4-O-methyl-glucuronoyl methylesterase-like domain-containing protein n=1 Tax=Stakelama marina TaxID=2826939 RepID=A0A8T4IFX3_9SPHN|nr:hypothetical protein [Stakelama marina]MBR0552942.1 hypothetical protein [Stakelama marina]
MRKAIIATGLALSATVAVAAQKPVSDAPRDLSAAQGRQIMMDKLDVTALRPGPSSDPNAPNHANYDEAKANPHPELPPVLTTFDGRKVTTPDMWWKVRRPEIAETYAREVYGRVPDTVPSVTWRVRATDTEEMGWPRTRVRARQLVGHVDNSAYPAIDVNIRMTVVTPADAKGPVPLLIMFGRDEFPAPSQPSRAEYERIDAAMKALLVRQDPSLAKVFDDHQALALASQPPVGWPDPNEISRPDVLIKAGWGYALLDTASVQADNGEGLTRGIIGLTNHGRTREPDQWGALRAWAWGASRALDYLQTDPTVDSDHVGIEGVSRWGKAALVTMAFDRRFAMGLIGSSGKGGTTPLRRNFGEAVANLGTGEYYWFAGNFLKYNATAGPGAKTITDLPVDSNDLIALCAPRLVFVSYGIPEKGDAKWLDHRGSWMATLAASPAWELFGHHGPMPGADYRTTPMPPVNHGLTDHRLAWRQHDGGHTDAPNIKPFTEWASKMIGFSPE